jgi:hypothetical protein
LTHVAPKRGIDAKFVHLLNHTADVVTDDLAKHFVDHGCVGLTPNGVTKLGLYHRERGLDIAALVILA